MIEEKKIRSDKAKNISKVLKEVINNPLATEREIAKATGIGRTTAHRLKTEEMEQIGAKSDIILEICDLDIGLVKKGLVEINRRFTNPEELKEIQAKDISTIIKESSARYSIFKGDITDKDGGYKEKSVLDSLNNLIG